MNMTLFEPITRETLRELQPGEWIWDNKEEARRAHKRTIYNESVVEPIGFRQIHILDASNYPYTQPFMLSSIDNIGFGSGNSWTYFEEGRFFRFKEEFR
jgi:hypothetical protein